MVLIRVLRMMFLTFFCLECLLLLQSMAFFYHPINWTPLHLTAKWDHFEAAEILIAAGAIVNAENILT